MLENWGNPVSNVWLLITVWGVNGAPPIHSVHSVPFRDVASCEAAAQEAIAPILAEKAEEYRRGLARSLVFKFALPLPQKPHVTFVCQQGKTQEEANP